MDASRYWFWKNSLSVTEQWKAQWGNKFLGMYYNDEPGGIQLDGNWSAYFHAFPKVFFEHQLFKSQPTLNQDYCKVNQGP